MRLYLTTPPERFARHPALPLLVWITISGTFPMHLLVPVLPEAAHDLGVSAPAIQAAITAYLIGLSSGQLFLGPFSDRFGRRPILLAGLAIYVVGTLGTALSPSLPLLLAARTLQAIGGCAGLVLGRAITRDIADDAGAVRKIAMLSSATSLGPGLAPLVGTHLAALVGWRGMLEVLAAVSTLLLLATILTLPETHVHRRPEPLIVYARNWGRLVRNPRFLRFCVGGAFATTSFYAFVANAPFIFHERFGFSMSAVGMLYLLVVGSLTIGSLIASRLAGRFAPHRVVIATGVLLTLASASTLIMEMMGTSNAIAYLAAIMVITASIGMCSPFAMTEAVNVNPAAIGAASGLYGCLQMAAGALIVVAVGLVPAPPVIATGITLLIASGIALLAFALPITPPGAEMRPSIPSEEVTDAAL